LDLDSIYAERIAALTSRAEGGEAKAMFDLGLLYDLPEKRDAPFDLERARHWYEKAAEAGHAWAQFALGNMHEKAHGTPRNQLAARKWYAASAEQGVAEAQMHLARMLQAGHGGPAEPAEAALWYERAANGGHELAATHLALMHLDGSAPQPSVQKALELLEFAADKLDGLAHLVLGDLHMRGTGVARHGGLALVHYCVACELLAEGPHAEQARTAREGLLARRPELRDEYETQAREFIEARRVPREKA
jgi:TPR repeat protein